MPKYSFVVLVALVTTFAVAANAASLAAQQEQELPPFPPPPPPPPPLPNPDPPPIEGVSTNPDDISFHLYPNAQNPEDYDTLVFKDVNSVTASRYDTSKRLIIYASGFLMNRTSDQAIKNAYLQAGTAEEANIVVVDWGKLSGNVASVPEGTLIPVIPEGFYLQLYIAVKENVDLTGQRIYEFVRFLEQSGQLPGGPSSVHYIGQSLGAHIGGYFGKAYRAGTGKLIDQITGTDPAGPFFQLNPPFERLSMTDAVLVDAIHTDAGGYGFTGPIGKVDFAVNGGKAPQPGCDEDGVLGYCSHNVAVEYYARSILDPTIVGTRFQGDEGNDDGNLETVGFGANVPRTAFGTYQVNLVLDSD